MLNLLSKFNHNLEALTCQVSMPTHLGFTLFQLERKQTYLGVKLYHDERHGKKNICNKQYK